MSELVVDYGAMSSYCTNVPAATRFPEILEAANVGTTLSPLAFGLTCSFFTAPAVAVQLGARGFIAALAVATDRTTQAVGECLADFQQTEQEAVVQHDLLLTSVSSADTGPELGS